MERECAYHDVYLQYELAGGDHGRGYRRGWDRDGERRNPAPGGGTSSALTFAINKPIPVVTISPASATVAAGGQQQFTANVRNSLNLAVTWEVNGISGGNATVGMISNAGLYIAPTAQASVTISAVSQADAHQSASATLSVLAPHPIGVRPTAAIAEFFNRNTEMCSFRAATITSAWPI